MDLKVFFLAGIFANLGDDSGFVGEYVINYEIRITIKENHDSIYSMP